MANTDTQASEEAVNTENIFDEFATDPDLQSEVKRLEESQKKDKYYYLNALGKFIKGLNILFFFILLLFLSYAHIQNTKNGYDLSFAEPVCYIFLGDASDYSDSCSGVEGVLMEYSQKLNQTRQKQYRSMIPLLGSMYGIDNFLKSKYISFLIETGESRVRPVEVLEAFDALKNEFEPILKSNIQCQDIVITENNIFKAKCEAFTARTDDKIVGFSGNRAGDVFVEGTSASLAASFINFIERNTDKFIVLNKQKEFNVERITGQGTYVKKTPFVIELQYVNNSLSL